MVWDGKDLQDQLTPDPIQPGLEVFLEKGIHDLCGQAVEVCHHPNVKDFFLMLSLNRLCSSLNPFTLILSQEAFVKSPFSAFLYLPSGTVDGLAKVILT